MMEPEELKRRVQRDLDGEAVQEKDCSDSGRTEGSHDPGGAEEDGGGSGSGGARGGSDGS